MKILSIESSHDDTSMAYFENGDVVKQVTISQTEFHKKFGGTVPEYASRHHSIAITKLVEEFKNEFDLSKLDHIAYTSHPGLIGSLHVGQLSAHALGHSLNKPVYPINHMHGHIFAAAISNNIIFPSIALIASGGHTQLWLVNSYEDISILGQTKDDAIGEVFDKVARKLELGFPGGPKIDAFRDSPIEGVDFKIKQNDTFDFSFSGFKTKVINYINQTKMKGELSVAAVSKGFQNEAVRILIEKTKIAIDKYEPKSIILGGGVSANSQLRDEFSKLHPHALIPEMKYTTDNASMIAITSYLFKTNK